MPHSSSPRWAREPGQGASQACCCRRTHSHQASLPTTSRHHWLGLLSTQSYLHKVAVPRIAAAVPSLVRGVPPALALSALHAKGKCPQE